VCSWVIKNFSEELGTKFEDEEISGKDLFTLTEDDLILLGFDTLGKRKDFHRKLNGFFPSFSCFFLKKKKTKKTLFLK